jgi:Zn-dependent protease with chaperone function
MANGQRSFLALPGFAIMTTGSLGWLAGRALKAAVSRQREFLADARAVQFTRSREGLGGVLRKVAGQQEQGMAPAQPAPGRAAHAAGDARDAIPAGSPATRLWPSAFAASTAGRWRRCPRGMMKCRRGPTPFFESAVAASDNLPISTSPMV